METFSLLRCISVCETTRLVLFTIDTFEFVVVAVVVVVVAIIVDLKWDY